MFEETGYEIHLELREERGRRKGRAEGREEGKAEQSREIARTMLAEGMDHAAISRITGLSADEVARLAQEQPE
jgi:predicted transposase/invertase (TIGR01784 family)